MVLHQSSVAIWRLVENHETQCHGLKIQPVFIIYISALSFYDIEHSLADVTTLCYFHNYAFTFGPIIETIVGQYHTDHLRSGLALGTKEGVFWTP